MGLKKVYPIAEIKEALERLNTDMKHLKSLSEGIPAVERNVNPMMAFIDILDFHLGDLEDNDHS